MKFKPHQEQKIWTEGPQSSIFMDNCQFYQDRVRKMVHVATLCDLKAKFSFCFYINIRTSPISSVYVYIDYVSIKSKSGASWHKYLVNSY